jgi:regulation of enolase protein 1 (concanavalin A-like superfamily)
VTVQYAAGSSTTSGTTTTLTTHALPYWVRLVKTGSSITHFESNDGTIWTQRGSSFTVSGLASDYLAGIAVASGSATATTATIDNLTVTGLSAGGSTGAETAANIGNAGPSGTHTLSSGSYAFNTPGSGISTSATTDNCRFVYMPVTASANCTITARLVAIGTTSTSARLGVMLRSSTAQNSIYAASLATGAASSLFYTMNRTAAGGSSNNPTTLSTPVLPQWFRLTRTGDSFASDFSKDGSTWTAIGTAQTLAPGPRMLAGLAVSAASDGSIATGVFDNVTLNAQWFAGHKPSRPHRRLHERNRRRKPQRRRLDSHRQRRGHHRRER